MFSYAMPATSHAILINCIHFDWANLALHRDVWRGVVSRC